jgi:hypothetical protein
MKVMKEMAKLGGPADMPFDARRIVCGGFKVLIGA